MKIDGELIATEIRKKLKEQIVILRQQNITPHLAVVLVGDNPSSQIYIRQKQKVGKELQVEISIFNFQFSISKQKLINLISKLNHDLTVHGIIIQRPVPIKIEQEELDKLVAPQKDVDGFHPNSPFTPPVVAAVLKILEWVHRDICGSYAENQKIFLEWLKKQKILIIGRGETAGRPIAKTLDKMGINFTVAHSQTTNLKELCLSANIIITCVGRPHIVRQYMVTSKTILVGVGFHIENDKLQADYNQEAIADKVAYYTPVPGGVGPVNVACLFANLLKAAEHR